MCDSRAQAMISRRVALTIVAVWLLLGPVAMAFDACEGMGAMCEAPCGLPSCAVTPPSLSAAPPLVALLESYPGSAALTLFPRVPDPPPESRSLSV